ncbi:hypothetical protein COEREDRAFT_97688 [Coemansia reversa NRRL 1564]|uniref:Homeobox domain-containing protein n=1 Tax=Coemansia reversa (strain ATCC 12441 / NRRL 1564) TaxID=763665 RepID=A0A2G5BBF4_COERN|nr:hypothetical protein COEREDRAFT_97688 [Coemansia reversa NRRL 1564]|eukprot:PIA16037.1 hypothetical protein COEREDRAFT_97688 [Coemansia reversa NRRL 1564]
MMKQSNKRLAIVENNYHYILPEAFKAQAILATNTLLESTSHLSAVSGTGQQAIECTSFSPPTPTSINQKSYLNCMPKLNMSSAVNTTINTDISGRVTRISPAELNITYDGTGPAIHNPESIGSLYSGNAVSLQTETPFNLSPAKDLPQSAMPNQFSYPQDVAALETVHSPQKALILDGEQADENNTALKVLPEPHQGFMQAYGQPMSQDDGQFSLATGCAAFNDSWSHGIGSSFFGGNNGYVMQGTQQLDVSGAMISLSSGASSSSSLPLAAHIPTCIPPAQLSSTHGVDVWSQRSENQQWAATLNDGNCMYNNMSVVAPEKCTAFCTSTAASAESLISVSPSACTQHCINTTASVSKMNTSAVAVDDLSQSENVACKHFKHEQTNRKVVAPSIGRPMAVASSRISSKVCKPKSRQCRRRASIGHMDDQHHAAKFSLPVANVNDQYYEQRMSEDAEEKRKKRKTRSNEQKRAFYLWLVENIHSPYPNDSERIHELNIDCMSKQEFKWWFSNHRHRSLEQYFDDEGKKCFRAKIPFYKACCRLNIHIPWEIPPDILSKVKDLRP